MQNYIAGLSAFQGKNSPIFPDELSKFQDNYFDLYFQFERIFDDIAENSSCSEHGESYYPTIDHGTLWCEYIQQMPKNCSSASILEKLFSLQCDRKKYHPLLNEGWKIINFIPLLQYTYCWVKISVNSDKKLQKHISWAREKMHVSIAKRWASIMCWIWRYNTRTVN